MLPQVFDRINEGQLTGKTFNVELGDLLTLHLTIDNITASDVKLNKEKTQVVLDSTENIMRINISDASAFVHIIYEVNMDPSLMSDNGTITLGFKDLSIELAMQFLKDRHQPEYIKILTNNITMSPDNLELNVTNENDLNKMVTKIGNILKYPILNVVGEAFEDYLELGINEGMKKLPDPIVSGDYSASMRALHPANITEGWLAFALNGTIFPTKNPKLPFNNTAKIPNFVKEGQSLQISISEFTLQSLIYTAYTNGAIKGSFNDSGTPLFGMDTTSMSYFLGSGLTNKYGRKRPMRITLEASNITYPNIDITTDDLELGGIFNIGFEVQTSDAMHYEEACSLQVNATFEGDVGLHGDLYLKVKLQKVSFVFDKVLQTRIGNINISMMTKLMGNLEQVIIYGTAIAIGNGLNIKAYVPFQIDIGTVVISWLEDYMTFQMTPYLKNGLRLENLENIIDVVSDPHRLYSSIASRKETKQILKAALREVAKSFKKEDYLYERGMEGVKTAYKSYKFFETVYNLPNPDYVEDESLHDL